MRSPRRLVAAAVAIAAIAALLWWWLGRESADEPDAREAIADGDGPRKGARPIGAEAEDETAAPSKLPWNRPRTSVSGRVTDETGKPVAKADVCARITGARLPSTLTREPICATSNADGTYVIAEVPPLRVFVGASAPTFIPGSYDPPGTNDWFQLHEGQAVTGIDIVVRSGGVPLHGVVKDIAGGVVDGAVVSTGRDWGDSKDPSFGKSDAQGAFTLWVEAGDHWVTALADGYTEGSKSGAAPGYTFEILLTPESVLAGRVVRASDGTPVADAYVSTEDGFWSEHNAYTDADGRFRLDRLEPGRFKPQAKSTVGYGQITESVLLGLGQTVDDIEITLHPMPTLRGRVVIAGDTERPCETGSVNVTGTKTKDNSWTELDSSGAVEIVALEPDTYHVDVRCEGYLAEAEYPKVVVAVDAALEEQVWSVKTGLALRGRVVDQDGKPIASASVSAQPTGNAGRAQQTTAWGERTAVDGTFELAGLLAGTYELHAQHDDHVAPDDPPKVTLTAGEKTDEQKLVLEAGGTVQGRVLDANERPVPGARVRIIAEKWSNGDTTTRDDGTFVIDALRPGDVRVVAQRGWRSKMRAPGTTDDDVQGVRTTVVAREVATVELVVEEQFGKITGKVIDADGGPVDDAFVHSQRESDSAATNAKSERANVRWGQWGSTPSLTEQDGSFELDEMQLGKHTLMAMRKGGGEGVVEHIETGATGVVIQLGEGGTISGKVTLSSGGAPHRFTIGLDDKAQGVSRNEEFFETAGQWRITDLPAGKYTVGVSATEGSADTIAELPAGGEKSGVALVLTPRVDVSGTVVDLETGVPVPGMQVSITSRKSGGGFFSFGGAAKENVTDEQGRFTVVAAPAGAVEIMVLPRNFSGSDDQPYGWSDLPGMIPGDAPTHELSPIRIAKSRIKFGDRGGDFGFTLKQGDPEQESEEVPLQVAVIRPGGPAAGSELKVGDVIVEVDGKDVRGANRYLYHSLTQVKQGDKVAFGIDGGGEVTLVAGKPP